MPTLTFLADHRRPKAEKKSRRPQARLVPLSPAVLGMALDLERDPLVAEIASRESAARMLDGWACLCDGELIGAGGLMLYWPGRAEAWVLVSRNARPRQIAAAIPFACNMLDRRQRDPTFRRIEATVRDDSPGRGAFMEALGFHHEAGPLKAWGPDGSDYHIYARVTA